MTARARVMEAGILAYVLLAWVLVVLKLTGADLVASWDWWDVTAPVWGPWALALMAVLAWCLVGTED